MQPKKSDARPIRLDSLLPASCEDFRTLGQLQEWYSWLWYDASLQYPDGDFDLLRAYSSLLIDSGIPHLAAIDCLVAISRADSRQVSSIRIPAQRHRYDARETEVGFNPNTCLALHCYLGNHRRDKADSDTRPNRLVSRITENIRKQFAASAVQSTLASLLNFDDLKRLGCLLALHFGSEPYLISALSNAIRPISQGTDDPYPLTDISQESLGHVIMQHDGLNLRRQSITEETAIESTEKYETPSDWVAASKNLLRDLCEELNSSINGHVNTPRKQAVANGVFDNYEQLAARLGPKDSAVMLAVKYARQYFVKKASITAGTLRQYLDRSVINGLLDNENSYSLGDWDADDFVENVEDRISSTRLQGRSRQLILSAYQPLLNYLSAELKIPRIGLNGFAQEYIGGAGQWRLIGPHAIDKVIFLLSRSENRCYRQCAIVISIAYYCGLRASEIRRLTLSDIVFDDVLPNTDIECLRGKTPNARRRIPIDKMAPENIINLVKNSWHERRSEFSAGHQLSAIHYLGPQRVTDGFQYDSLVMLTRQLLKAAFGQSATVHLLRHCYCSNLFVRWYALRHPDVLDNIRDRSHSLFQPRLQSQLNSYFDCLPFDDGDVRPYDLVSMIKLTGHASPETLLRYYVHSFSIIQIHAARLMRTQGFERPLPDATIARLIPGMKSSASRAKLRTRTLDGIISTILTGCAI